jgi:hypothetical protein
LWRMIVLKREKRKTSELLKPSPRKGVWYC